MDEADDLMVNDWDAEWESWMRYIGPRVREVWSTLPHDLRQRLVDDAAEMADEAWSDGIDAMGEDA